MDLDSVLTLCRNTLWLTLTISAPILIAGIVTGLLVGLFQALTQIQEQTLAVILKIIVMAVTAACFLPWMLGKLTEFARLLFENIPDSISPLI